MKSMRTIGTGVVATVLAGALIFKAGCAGDDFLGLEDYQRDLLLGGLAAAILLGNQGDDGVEPTPGEPMVPWARRARRVRRAPRDRQANRERPARRDRRERMVSQANPVPRSSTSSLTTSSDSRAPRENCPWRW